MIFSDGVDVATFAGAVVLTAYMLQMVMRAVITAVAAIIAILRIVLSPCRKWFIAIGPA